MDLIRLGGVGGRYSCRSFGQESALTIAVLIYNRLISQDHLSFEVVLLFLLF